MGETEYHFEGEGTEGGPAVAHVAVSQQVEVPLIYAEQVKVDRGVIPRATQCTFAVIIILAIIDVLGMYVNMINSAEVAIIINNKREIDEFAWIGWNKLELWSDSDATGLTESVFYYDDRCDNDECTDCIVIDWCELETKGKHWHYGFYARLMIAGVVFISYILMVVRSCACKNNNNNNNNNNGLTSKQIFYRQNRWLILCLFELSLLAFIVACIYSIVKWNTNNPVYDFDSVKWAVSLVMVLVEAIFAVLMFVLQLIDFWRNK